MEKTAIALGLITTIGATSVPAYADMQSVPVTRNGKTEYIMVDEDSGYAKDMKTGEIFPANNGIMLDKKGGGTTYNTPNKSIESNLASDYIAEANRLIANKSPPQEIINTLEIALNKNVVGSTKEIIYIHDRLSANYGSILKYNESLKHLEAIKKINPNHPYIDFSISQTKLKIQKR